MNTPEVVVIGSGAGGAAASWKLAQSGVRVLILEAGPRYQPAADYRLFSPQWEQRRFPEKIPSKVRQTHAPLQALEARWDHLRSWRKVGGRMNASQTRAFWNYHHVVGLGGSTLHYVGEAHRLHPAALSMYSRFGVGADWPVTYAELEPYYLEAERIIGVAGPDDPGARQRSAPYPLPPHPHSYASQRLGAGCRQLGLTWTPNPVAILSQPYDGRPACNYCGGCHRGCPRLDKGSADITFITKALATGNCTVAAECQALKLEAGSQDTVEAAVYVDRGGQTQRITAQGFVLACGAVETPRLLLNSTGPGYAEGLANEAGQVGRHFMETLSWVSCGLHPEPLGSHRGLPCDAICWDYNAPDTIASVVGGCRFNPGMAEADLVGPINYAERIVGGWGREHKRRLRETFGHLLAISAIGESLPDARSFIALDPEAKDRHGLPKARIHSFLSDSEIQRLDFMAKTARAILEAAGVTELVEEYGTYDAFNATHVFGTCRMGPDPATSVVDPYCRSHRWRNLLITDASLFPSSGGGESPSLTISALALRAVDKWRQ